MEKRKKIRRLLVAALTVITTVLPPLLYSFLIRRGLEGVYMFGGDSFFWVGAVSVLGAAGIMIVLRGREEPQSEEPEESEDDSFEYFEDSPAVDTATAREEYPELFSKKEKTEDEPAISSSSYHEALAAALNAQKAEYTEPAENGESEVGEAESFFYEKKEEDIPVFLWDDLPDTLPEGYKAYEEEPELDESADETEDEDAGFEEQHPRGGIFKRVLLTLLLIAVPLGFSVFMSFFRTDYYAEGIVVSSPLGNREYAWKDCTAYEIAPSFFGDRLLFTVVMNDGAEIELLPADMQIIGDDFDDPYAYGVYVAEKLSYANVEKKVRERDTLESDLALREDIGEYVKKLIE